MTKKEFEMECPNCKKEFEPDCFPFGDDVQCEHCHSVFETDWDYADYDSMHWWIVDLIYKPAADPATEKEE